MNNLLNNNNTLQIINHFYVHVYDFNLQNLTYEYMRMCIYIIYIYNKMYLSF